MLYGNAARLAARGRWHSPHCNDTNQCQIYQRTKNYNALCYLLQPARPKLQSVSFASENINQLNWVKFYMILALFHLLKLITIEVLIVSIAIH